MAVDRRRHADPVGQSGRRPPVRRGQYRSPCRKNLRAGRPAPAAGRAARRPAARRRRDPAGALAGIWRGTRRAFDLRLLAVRLSRWQPRRSDRRRQHRADHAATGAGTARQRDAASRRIIGAALNRASLVRAGLIRASLAAERTRHARHGATGRAATGSRLRTARTIGRSARRVCAVRCFCRTCRRPPDEPPATKTIARTPPPAIEAFASQPVPHARRLPLRFTWQMDREGRFTLGTDEFLGLIGPRTTAAFGRPWREIAETFGFDPTGRMMQAFATGATWSGITLNWPVDGGGTLPVELSGLPIFDAARNFIGYRGFGVCRDFDALARLAALRLAELSGEMMTPQELSAAPSAEPASVASPSSDELPEPIAARPLLQRLLLQASLQSLHIKTIWKRPWNLPRKPSKKASRKQSPKTSKTSPGNRQGRADGSRNGVAGRHCRKRVAIPRPGRSEAVSADAS